MTQPFDPHAVATRLSAGQRSMLSGLDREFCVIGCGEDVARNLCEPRSTRPALAQRRRGAEFQEYAVTDAGAAVKEVL